MAIFGKMFIVMYLHFYNDAIYAFKRYSFAK